MGRVSGMGEPGDGLTAAQKMLQKASQRADRARQKESGQGEPESADARPRTGPVCSWHVCVMESHVLWIIRPT